MQRFQSITVITALLFSAPLLHAEDPLPQVERLKSSPVLRHLKLNPFAGEAKTGPEKTVAQMYVPDGFKVELVAAEPDMHQPIAFAFDERGRIWVLEAYSYPTKREPGQGLDKVVIFSDENGDGTFETRKVFAEGLNLASGIEVGFGGVWIGAAPELLFIPDRNRDDKPDGPPQIMLDGFGYQDTHETLNSFLWGPDGWLYGIQGVFNTARIGRPGVPSEQRPELRAGVWRFHPVKHVFEIYAHGGSNPWGLDYDERGQMFMTHCRSYFGRGLTTHVIQGGQFWNQVNANYAPFIIPNSPRDFPGFRNYLLASARYDHGAGGAGAPGSDAIYGGHSHVGTMIYLGDNWPEEYRGRLFTHNLGGHQINQQINKPLGSGFDTVHAGQDVLFCTDPKYVAVDLQYGPDGAVYFIDWHDMQHCHNPNTERWDRSNGRLYRMQWQASYKPVTVNLGAKSDLELVDLLHHKNAWFGRTAQRLMHERSIETQAKSNGAPRDEKARARIIEMARSSSSAESRLKALWTAHAMGGFNQELAKDTFRDRDEYVRAWSIQFWSDFRDIKPSIASDLIRLAKEDPSPVVRRYLASAIQYVPETIAWQIAEALAQRGEDKDDRNQPYLLWHSLGTLMEHGRSRSQTAPLEQAGRVPMLDRLFALAGDSKIPQLTDWIYWYAATLEGEALNRVVTSLKPLEGDALRRRLAGLWLAMEPRANVPMPAAWNSVARSLYDNADVRVRRDAERLAAAFGDASAFPKLREILANASADRSARQHAFAVLSRAQDRAALPVFLKLLDEAAFRESALKLVGRFDAPEVGAALIERFDSFETKERAAALDALTSRAPFAIALLDAVAGKKIGRDQLTAFHVRRLTELKSAQVDERVASTWGKLNQTPAEKEAQIARLEMVFNEAPLWAFSASAGRQHFQKLCMQCHRLGNDGTQLGPELTGAGKHGIRYYLENIIDPDAVIGTDFQATTIETKDDETLSGLLVSETDSAVTLRMTTGETIIPKSNISERILGQKSLMPEGLLDSLGERELIELLKFLTSN